MRNTLLMSALLVVLSACYPGGPEYVSELDLIASDYDPDFDFSAQQRFYLLDTVIHIIDDDPNTDISRIYDSQILATTRANMLSRGYEEVSSIAEADITLNISAWQVTSTNYYYGWGGYWGWGYPGYGGGWGWGYPPAYGYASSYTFGTLMIQMAYPDGADLVNQTIPVVWTGLLNGLLDGTTASTQDRIVSGIDQCFEQSPYIIRSN